MLVTNILLLSGLILIVETRKNVLFLVADDLRAQLGSYYGPYFPTPTHPKMHTPNTDALAARSLLLLRAYVQQPICSPSRTSLLTSRRPDTTHVYDLHHYFRLEGGDFTTIPQYFKQNGYISIGMGKIFHPSLSASGRDDPVSWSVPYFHANITHESNARSWEAIPNRVLVKTPLRDQQIANQAVATLRKLARRALYRKKPFFLAVGFHKPHLPFVFPESMLKFYPQCSIRLPDNPFIPENMPTTAWHRFGGLLGYEDLTAVNASGKMNTTFPDTTVMELRRAYYSAVTFVDSLIGRVINELTRLGLANDTVISMIGDHGWHLGEHGLWGKDTNFEIATHAPMMIRIPGLTDMGVQTSQLVEFVDLFPTLVDAVGLPPLRMCPEKSNRIKLCREGSSLLPLINDPATPIKDAAFSQSTRKTRKRSMMGYTIRTDKHRYTEWVKFDKDRFKPRWTKVYGKELYDHTIDPGENFNRVDDIMYRDVVKKLRNRLHAGWRYAIVS